VAREPEQAQLLLAVETFGRTAQKATQENALKMERMLQTLVETGLSKAQIQTASYSLDPKYERPDSRRGTNPEPIGFTARNMVRVTVDSVKRVGLVIDAAIGAGANRVANLAFQLRNPETAYREALRLAVANAKADAEALANAAGRRLGPPLRISTSGGTPIRESAGIRAFKASAPTPVEGGTIQINARVTVYYRLEDE
jgi:hypothetical protein